ncbi:trehalose-6-phosphate synthase [Bradyrhizobium sp. CCBAU 21360]|uniref:trehalose-6-phosphate synthase n=1 Tax=Bradyrhizobium sp. CCBAU 21360 TaxID=1325081 RepID=UPI003FA46741
MGGNSFTDAMRGRTDQHPGEEMAARDELGAIRHDACKEDVENAINHVNAEHGTDEWRPIHYTNDPFSQAALARLYRVAHVGVVTPLRDGMNLVAQEYVAAQDPKDPGVLVLSKFAGRLKSSTTTRRCWWIQNIPKKSQPLFRKRPICRLKSASSAGGR